jgi:hypothetical protein
MPPSSCSQRSGATAQHCFSLPPASGRRRTAMSNGTMSPLRFLRLHLSRPHRRLPPLELCRRVTVVQPATARVPTKALPRLSHAARFPRAVDYSEWPQPICQHPQPSAISLSLRFYRTSTLSLFHRDENCPRRTPDPRICMRPTGTSRPQTAPLCFTEFFFENEGKRRA